VSLLANARRRQRARLLTLALVSSLAWISGLSLGYLIGTKFGANF
jgi:hypothetical protein